MKPTPPPKTPSTRDPETEEPERENDPQPINADTRAFSKGNHSSSNILDSRSSSSSSSNRSVTPTSKKTKTAAHEVEFHTSKVQPLPEIKVNGTTLKVVEEFKYLGSTENDDATLDTEVDRRIYAMKRAFYMDYILLYRRKSITLRARMQMFIAKVTAVAVYGCAAWNYTQRHLAKLESTYFQLLKRLIRMKKPWHQITYEDIVKTENEENSESAHYSITSTFIKPDTSVTLSDQATLRCKHAFSDPKSEPPVNPLENGPTT
jgi:hypothetical protein